MVEIIQDAVHLFVKDVRIVVIRLSIAVDVKLNTMDVRLNIVEFVVF